MNLDAALTPKAQALGQERSAWRSFTDIDNNRIIGQITIRWMSSTYAIVTLFHTLVLGLRRLRRRVDRISAHRLIHDFEPELDEADG